MIELKELPKKIQLDLVRGCEPFYVTYRSPLWQKPIVEKLKKEFGNKYEIPIKVILTAAAKAKRYGMTGTQFPLDFMKFKKAESKTTKEVPYTKTKDLIALMEKSGYLTLLKGYYKLSDEGITTCIRFHDKLLNNLDKKHCDKWGMSRMDGFTPLEVVDSQSSSKGCKVFHSLKKFKGVKAIRDEIILVNKEIESHLITYNGDTCSVLYKRRFEDDLQSGGRWYVVGTFQIESSEGRKSILIDTECTTEQDIARIHPSILATRAGFTLPDDYDPYDITPYVQTSLDFKQLRDFIKPCFMVLLYANSRHTALHEIREKLWKDEEVNKHLSAETILEALEERNFMFKDDFYNKDNWKFCQYIDGRICTKVMVHFAKQGKVCLGYHDSWIVKSQDKQELIEVITGAWEEVLGNTYNLKIEEEFDNSYIVQEKHPAFEDIPIEFYEEK